MWTGISGVCVAGGALSGQDGNKGSGWCGQVESGAGEPPTPTPGTDPALRPLPSQRGTYLPQTYIIQEEMVVTEHVSDKEALGSFIYHLCSGKDTYRLRRRATRRREWPAPPVRGPCPEP